MSPQSTFFLALLALILNLTASSSSSSSSFHLFPTGPEKHSHLHFFIHDKISSPNATAVKVTSTPHPLPSASGLNFASVFVVDDLITVGPDPTSKVVGRARGLYSVSSLTGSDLYFSIHAVFTSGIYKGSSLAVLARDPILEAVRELPIVGGTGYFRLARGFAFMKTHLFNVKTGDAVLEVDAHVLHH